MNDERLVDASRRRPPAAGTKLALTAGAASAETALATKGQWTFAVNVAFSIAFGVTGMSAPTDTADFVAGVYDFWIPDGVDYFRIMPTATGSMTYWRSGILSR